MPLNFLFILENSMAFLNFLKVFITFCFANYEFYDHKKFKMNAFFLFQL